MESNQGNKASLYSLCDVPENEVERAKDLLAHGHPFTRVKTVVSKNLRVKKKESKINLDEDEDALKALLRQFRASLTLLLSCFNKRKGHFIKCGCINKLQHHCHAIDDLITVALMTKKEQDDLYKELING
jgi:hypothetical protein